MTVEGEQAAAAVGLVRLVLLEDVEVARYLVEALSDDERQAVAGVLEQAAADAGATIVDLVRELGHDEPVRAASAVASLLDLAAWLQGIDELDLDRVLLERLDERIRHALGLEPVREV